MDFWDQLVECICRPPRDDYAPEQLLGGPAGSLFSLGPVVARRLDSTVTNKRGQALQVSHYVPWATATTARGGGGATQRLLGPAGDGRLPAVIYLHCNSGSRRDAEEAVRALVPMGVGVVAFDFAGSGRSDGDWVTLGHGEADDLEAVAAWLRSDVAAPGAAGVGLWGRSMGAVTALLYAGRDADIKGVRARVCMWVRRMCLCCFAARM